MKFYRLIGKDYVEVELSEENALPLLNKATEKDGKLNVKCGDVQGYFIAADAPKKKA